MPSLKIGQEALYMLSPLPQTVNQNAQNCTMSGKMDKWGDTENQIDSIALTFVTKQLSMLHAA